MPASSIALKIFFHGLIAFMPNRDLDSSPNQMTAFLLNHNDHLPVLWFEMNKASSCPEESISTGATNKSNACGEESTDHNVTCRVRKDTSVWCACELHDGVKITLTPDPMEVSHVLKWNPDDVQRTEDDSADFSWLMRMATIAGPRKAIGLPKWSLRYPA